jgi:hypothetical protein
MRACHVPARRASPLPLTRVADCLRQLEAARKACHFRIQDTEIANTLLEDDDQEESENPIHYRYSGDVRSFISICGFSSADCSVLSQPLDPILSA